MLARIEGGDRYFGVEGVGQGDGNGVNVGVGDDFAPIGVYGGDTVAGSEGIGTLAVGVANGHDLGVAMAFESGDVAMHGDGASADNANTGGIAHVVRLLCGSNKNSSSIAQSRGSTL